MNSNNLLDMHKPYILNLTLCRKIFNSDSFQFRILKAVKVQVKPMSHFNLKENPY